MGQSEECFETLVKGSRRYDVRLDLPASRGKGRLVAQCTCPYFDQGDLCKHIWATILQADADGWGVDCRQGAMAVEWGGSEPPASEIVYEEEGYESFDDDEPFSRRQPQRSPPVLAASMSRVEADAGPFDWQQLLSSVTKQAPPRSEGFRDKKGAAAATRVKELWYGVDFGETKDRGELTLEIFQREQKANSIWGPMKPIKFDRHEVRDLKDGTDRQVLGALFGADSNASSLPSMRAQNFGNSRVGIFEVPPALYDSVLKVLAKTERCAGIEVASSLPYEKPLRFEEGIPWHFELALKSDPTSSKDWLLEGRIRREDDVLPLSAPKAILSGGLVLHADAIARLVPLTEEEVQWVRQLREKGAAQILGKDLDAFVAATAGIEAFPRIAWPEGTGWTTVVGVPEPKLLVLSKAQGRSLAVLTAHVGFTYDGRTLLHNEPTKSWVDRDQQRLIQRDFGAEERWLALLLGTYDFVYAAPEGESGHVAFPSTQLAELTDRLTESGWLVEAEGHRLHVASKVEMKVSSGLDWFDLDGGVQFGKEKVTLPTLLAAFRHGDRFVRLDNGGLGLLPEAWLQQFADIAELGLAQKSGVRFGRNQATILDALLADHEDVTVDRDFAKVRADLKAFAGVHPSDPSPGFKGDLRQYQKEGLGWLRFLNQFRFGGCLADDMGLGKTIQVLALLQGRVLENQGSNRPTLIVVPRSLVGNWLSEAAKFCPDLKMLDFASLDRKKWLGSLAAYDVVVTTYGVMRRDIEKLVLITFDYVILDEAQAIKNESSQVAKAARLLKSEHKLALTGTPVENHLGELGSIFAFLNPGMLKPALLAGIGKSSPEKDRRAAGLLSKCLSPFILRRTKEQVLKDLPEKIEQTLFCELSAPQRKHYEELRRHYQLHLTNAAAQQGVNQIKIQVLEALLRLRQAACHPGLIDPNAVQEPSAKLDTLLEQIEAVIETGHKALIFSQFTSLLAIVKSRLDQKGIRYEYLDGQTRDRQGAVDSFQNNSEVPLFLISLKAGGVGLNLTAADYCFILDPWWNPAAEAQAIARAHRMGQTKRVFAYRLIAKDTVEEKILALQDKKKALASAIISEDSSILRGLSLEDLRLLLS